MLKKIKQRLLWPRREDREAVERSERFLQAFMDGDSEVMQAEIARRHGKFFALLGQIEQLGRDIDNDK